MNCDFTALSKALSTHSHIALSREAREVCNFSPNSHQELFKILTPQEQNQFQSHFQLATRNIKQLSPLAFAEENSAIYTVVERHLLAIREYHKQKPETAHVLDNSQIELLNQIKAQYRETAAKNLTQLFSCCHDDQDITTINKLLESATPHHQHTYIENLAVIIPRCRRLEWGLLVLIAKEDREEQIAVLAKLVRHCKVISANQIVELIKIVSQNIQTPERLEAVLPLLSLLTTNSHILDIVRMVASCPDEERHVVVESVKRKLANPTSGKRVNNVLFQEIYQDNVQLYQSQIQSILASENGIVFQTHLAGDKNKIRFVVDEHQLSSKPVEILSRFVELVNQKKPFFIVITGKINSEYSAMVEFIPKLLKGLCSNFHVVQLPNGLVRPEKAHLSPEEETTLQNIGQLFMYCQANMHQIGKQLDISVFKALKLLPRKLLKIAITKDTFDQFYPTYQEMLGLTVNQEFNEKLLESMKKALVPCMAIRSSMTIRASTTAEDLEVAIQGAELPQQIVDNIQFRIGINPKDEEALKSWVLKMAKNSTKKKLFFRSITGSPILTPKPISITMHGNKLSVSPATQTLTLPANKSIHEALAELDDALETGIY